MYKVFLDVNEVEHQAIETILGTLINWNRKGREK